MQSNAIKPRNQIGVAIAAIVIAVLALSFSDAVVKQNGTALPLWQLFILRSSLALPILGLMLLKRRSWRVESLAWVVVRSLLLVVMWLCYYSALPHMGLSLAAATYYTAPIFITIIAASVSRQFPSIKIWSAIFLGFVGVLLILRPEASEFKLVTMLPIIAAIIYAATMVLTTIKCRDDDPIVLVVVLNLVFVGSGLLLGLFSGVENSFIFGAWAPLNSDLWSLIAVLATAMTIGSIGAVIAYQKGPPATIAAFDYSYLVFSLIWAALFFGEYLDLLSLIGMLAITAAGILALPKKAV